MPLELKDGDPANKVRVLCNSILNKIMSADNARTSQLGILTGCAKSSTSCQMLNQVA